MCVVKKRGLPEYCVKVAQNLLLGIGNCSILPPSGFWSFLPGLLSVRPCASQQPPGSACLAKYGKEPQV